jgi:hypothetical protein
MLKKDSQKITSAESQRPSSDSNEILLYAIRADFGFKSCMYHNHDPKGKKNQIHIHGHGIIVMDLFEDSLSNDACLSTRNGYINDLIIYEKSIYDVADYLGLSKDGNLLTPLGSGGAALAVNEGGVYSIVDHDDLYHITDSSGAVINQLLIHRYGVNSLVFFNNCLYDAGTYGVKQTTDENGNLVDRLIIRRQSPVTSLVVFNGCLYDAGKDGVYQTTDEEGNVVDKNVHKNKKRDPSGCTIGAGGYDYSKLVVFQNSLLASGGDPYSPQPSDVIHKLIDEKCKFLHQTIRANIPGFITAMAAGELNLNDSYQG